MSARAVSARVELVVEGGEQPDVGGEHGAEHGALGGGQAQRDVGCLDDLGCFGAADADAATGDVGLQLGRPEPTDAVGIADLGDDHPA